MIHAAFRHLAAIAALASSAVLQTPKVEAGAVALQDCWSVRGGSAARTGRTETAPIKTRVTPRWTKKFEGLIESEPLVWRDRIVVAERRAPGLRFLWVLDRTTGRERYKPRRVKSTMPLEPSIWNEFIVYRANVKQLAVVRCLSRMLAPMITSKSWKFDKAVDAPLMFQREVYVNAGGTLHKFFVGRPTHEWRRQLKTVGPVALRGDHVFSARLDEHIGVCIVRRSDGNRTDFKSSELPRQWVTNPRVQVGAHDCALYFDLIKTANGFPSSLTANTLRWRRYGEKLSKKTQASNGVAEMAWFDRHWFGKITDQGKNTILARGEKGSKVQVLAQDDVHPELLQGRTAASFARSVLYLDNTAIDSGKLEILWSNDEIKSVVRPIPVRGGLLVCPNRHQVQLLGSEDNNAESNIWQHPKASEIDGAFAMLSDGTIVDDILSVDATAGVASWGAKGKENAPLDAITWISSGNDTPLIYNTVADFSVVFEELRDRYRRKRIAPLFELARKSKDIALFAKTFALGARYGVPETKLKFVGRQLTQLQKNRKRLKPNAKKAAEVEAVLATLEHDARTDLWATYTKIHRSAPFRLRYEFLRSVLSEDPSFAPAIDATRKLLPKELRKTDPFDALEWLEFAKACTEIEIRFVEPGDPTDTSIPKERRELQIYREMWGGRGHANLIGIRSKHMFVVTTAKAPGRLARCLSVGELVCETLDKMFATDKDLRGSDVGPMKLILFDSRKEYMAAPDLGKPQKGRRLMGHLGWTAGHYSPHENNGDGISRMYLPKDKAEFEQHLDVFAHELTHHWIDQRCPRFAREDRIDSNPAAIGCWIVEGFAQLIDTAVFDVDNRRIVLRNPTNDDLALLIDGKKPDAKAWEWLFRTTKPGMAKIDPNPGSIGNVTRRFQLGTYVKLSEMDLFYAMSSAACSYLYHAENGKYRAKLMDYVVAYYTALERKPPELKTETAFGMTETQLGEEIMKFAQRVIETGKF